MSVRSLSILVLAAVSSTSTTLLPVVLSSSTTTNNVDGTGSVGGVYGGVDPSTSSTSMLRRRNSSSSSSRRPPPSQFDTPANDSNHHRRDESIAEDSDYDGSSIIRALGETSSNPVGRQCQSNEKYFKLDLRTDEYGFENSWTLKKRNKSTGGWTMVASGPPGDINYAASSSYQGGYCLSSGEYKFTMTDLFKDGMCCTTGNGRYIGYVDGTQRFSSPSDNSDWETRSHPFSISTGSTSSNGNNSNGSNNSNSNNSNNNLSDLPFDSKITSTTDRDDEWLVAHNTRRKEWHERYGKSYVPLSWSNALKEQSRDYAEKLLASSCGELIHDPNSQYGENLAAHSGTGSFAAVRSADSIVARWVDNEADQPYPDNAHLTQVLWRGTTFVGCDEASKSRSGGGMCYIQVCRYARPGNCNMASYRSSNQNWWVEPMLQDDSPCTPACPPDGC